MLPEATVNGSGLEDSPFTVTTRLPLAAARAKLAGDLLIPEPGRAPNLAVDHDSAAGGGGGTALGDAEIVAVNRDIGAVPVFSAGIGSTGDIAEEQDGGLRPQSGDARASAQRSFSAT
jgi:hypothetical protein